MRHRRTRETVLNTTQGRGFFDCPQSSQRALFTQNLFVLKGQRSYESCHSFLLMSLSLGRGAGARPSAARHCGGAFEHGGPSVRAALAASQSGSSARCGASLSGSATLLTSKAESFHVGAHVSQTARLANTGSRRVPSPGSGRVSSDQKTWIRYLLLHSTQHLKPRFDMWYPCLPSPVHHLLQ